MILHELADQRPMQVQHVKGNGTYTILGHCVIEATGELAVLYRGNGSATIWCRPAAEFFDGRFQCPEIAHDRLLALGMDPPPPPRAK